MQKIVFLILLVSFLWLFASCGEIVRKSNMVRKSDIGESSSFSRSIQKKQKIIEIVKEEIVGAALKEKKGIVQLEFQYGALNRYAGTGFFVQHEGQKFLVTAEHTVGWSQKVKVFRSDGNINVKFKDHISDTKNDITVFAVEIDDEECFSLEKPLNLKEIPLVGEIYRKTAFKPINVEMYGYPKSFGFRKVEGTIYQKMESDGLWMLISTGRSVEGMSGGPWLNKENGCVVGVFSRTVGILIKGSETYGSGGVPVNVIYKLIDHLNKKQKSNGE